jgi:hypothetical protein
MRDAIRCLKLLVGGFSTRAEAQRAVQNKLARFVPGGRSATITVGPRVLNLVSPSRTRGVLSVLTTETAFGRR